MLFFRMTLMAVRRIKSELKNLINECPIGYNAEPLSEDNLFHWQAAILGPDGSDYQGGIFYLEVKFPNDYPFKPPRVHFLTPILHPNVHSKSGVGYLSLDYAKNWSPAWTISKLLFAIRLILSEPNPNDPLNSELAELYLKDRETYHEQVRKHTETHAIKKKQEYCLITFQKQPSRLSPLTGLCRIAIKNRLRQNNPAEVNHNIKLLPLPTRIKQFLLTSYPF